MQPLFAWLALVTMTPPTAAAPLHVVTSDIVGAAGASAQLRGVIDRATGATTISLVAAPVARPAGYTAADYATFEGPESRSLDHQRLEICGLVSCTAADAVDFAIAPARLQEFVDEGEPWRIVLAGASVPVIELRVPAPTIIAFLDAMQSYQATHPAGSKVKSASR